MEKPNDAGQEKQPLPVQKSRMQSLWSSLDEALGSTAKTGWDAAAGMVRDMGADQAMKDAEESLRDGLQKGGVALTGATDSVTAATDSVMKGLTTKKRATWNIRFYLLMVDVRTLASTVPEDVGILRKLSDAAGSPLGFVPASGVATSEVMAEGVRCVWCWPSAFKTPAEVPTKMVYAHGGAFCWDLLRRTSSSLVK